MCSPAARGWTYRKVPERVTSFGVAAGVLIIVLTGAVGALHAQTVSAAKSESGAQASGLPASLQGVPGVKAGMTPEQLLEAGRAAVEEGRLGDGRKILLALIAQDRTNLEAMSHLAFAYERSAEEARGDGSDPKAVAQADRFRDQMADVYLEAAALALRQDRISTAEQMYSRVLIHRPATARALLGLARIFAATDRRIQAIDRYQSYLDSPAGREDAEAYLELGELYLQGGHWRQALDTFHHALKSSPDNADVHEALARAYHKGDRIDEALDAARQATEKAPRKAKYRATLAEIRIASGDAEQASLEARRAIEYAREAFRETPDEIKLLHELSGYYEVYERSLGELLKAGQAGLAVRVDLARAIQEHAAVERTLSLHRALKVLAKAPAESKDDVRLLETLAEVQKGLARLEDAAKTCKRLLKRDPDNAIARRVMNEIKAAAAP